MTWKALIAGILLLAAACATTPYTNRSQFILLDSSQEVALGADAYQQVLKQEPIVRDAATIAAVREVGERIARVANRPDYKWEFTVIDDPKQANAFALPGGKVAVYTGLFPIARDSAGLAAVLGHEVAHAIARHGAERMSQNVLVELAGTGLAVGIGSYSPATQGAIMGAFGLGAQYGVVLPFGRSQESEADHIGLILMAKAGYDPEAALQLWQRFEAVGGGNPPEFLSTHPGYGTRQTDIRKWLPEARQYLASPSAPVKPLP